MLNMNEQCTELGLDRSLPDYYERLGGNLIFTPHVKTYFRKNTRNSGGLSPSLLVNLDSLP